MRIALKQKFNFLLYSYAIAIACCWGVTIASSAIAKPIDPLQLDRSDPFIPKGYGRRELSSFERYRLQKEIAKLDNNARAELDLGNINSAMKLWYRRLRLTRVIGTKAEVKALGKVGAVAWQENLGKDVRNIANRLSVIQAAEATKNNSSQLLNNLAMAYESIKYLDKAIDIYQQGLATNAIDKDKAIDKLGELYLALFDYDNAAKIYQTKLANATQKEQKTILQTLVEIYDRNGQINKSIEAKKQVVKYYVGKKKLKKISALKIAIANDYQTLKQVQKAINFYQQAFDLAFKNQQLAMAIDALNSIGKLQQKENIRQAIETYNRLITIQQQSYNYYGLINTYDTLGKIYLKSNKNKAKQFFQQGLDTAITLNHKVKYFRDRLTKLSQ